MQTDINRLKVVLAEKKRTNKWLCEQLGVNPSTVSKWCTNSSIVSESKCKNFGLNSLNIF